MNKDVYDTVGYALKNGGAVCVTTETFQMNDFERLGIVFMNPAGEKTYVALTLQAVSALRDLLNHTAGHIYEDYYVPSEDPEQHY